MGVSDVATADGDRKRLRQLRSKSRSSRAANPFAEIHLRAFGHSGSGKTVDITDDRPDVTFMQDPADDRPEFSFEQHRPIDDVS
jgi:hypothetical protein